MKQLLLAIALSVAASVPQSYAETLVALTADGKLRYFDSETPGVYQRSILITGLPANTTVVGLDCTATNLMILVTVTNNVLHASQIDPDTGVVIKSIGGTIGLPPNTTSFAVDAAPFDQFFSHVSVMTNPATLYRISTNGVGTDGNFVYASGDPHAGASPTISGLAYSNNFLGAKASVLYGIDSFQATLVTLDLPGDKLKTVGSLGLITNRRLGFEISGVSGIAYAALSAFGTGTTLYTVDLTTGAATQKADIGPGSPPASEVVVDITSLPRTHLANISTRSQVAGGENVMIAGFIAPGGGNSARLIIRGLGPSLAAGGVASPLADPLLSIVDGNGAEIASNDNWRSPAANQTAVQQTGIPPSDDLEAAYVGDFPAGAYTAILSGKDGGTGVGAVEVYQLR